MRVKELIAELQKANPELEVFLSTGDEFAGGLRGPEDVGPAQYHVGSSTAPLREVFIMQAAGQFAVADLTSFPTEEE